MASAAPILLLISRCLWLFCFVICFLVYYFFPSFLRQSLTMPAVELAVQLRLASKQQRPGAEIKGTCYPFSWLRNLCPTPARYLGFSSTTILPVFQLYVIWNVHCVYICLSIYQAYEVIHQVWLVTHYPNQFLEQLGRLNFLLHVGIWELK